MTQIKNGSYWKAKRNFWTLTALQAFIFLFLSSGSGLATVTYSFNDAQWEWVDLDGRSGTTYVVTSASNMQITANGDDVWTGDDEYGAYFLNNVQGDFEVWVKIINQTNTDGWAKAGIMVRNDMTKNGPTGQSGVTGYCMVAITPSNGYAFQWDSGVTGVANGYLDQNVNTSSSVYPSYVKLKKVGNTFSGYYKIGTGAYTLIRSETIPTALGIQDVGLFVSSHTSGALSTVSFNEFKAQNALTFVADPPATPAASNVAASAGANGSITPSGTVLVPFGTTQAFTINPNTGYQIDTILWDSGVTPTANPYRFTGDGVSSHTLSVSFKPNMYTITAVAGTNGNIEFSSGVTVENGTSGVSVAYGATETLTVSPNLGYVVNQVLVDSGVTTLTGNQYTFNNVTTNHTMAVTFIITSNTITATAGANGSINPSGGVTVAYGSNKTFTVTPNSGYTVDRVLVDSGVTTLTGGQYTFNNVTTAHTIDTTFRPLTYTINASSGVNGSITPVGNVSVNHGSGQTFTVAPDSGYVVDAVTVDAGSAALDVNNQYTFSNVTSGHTIYVTFTDNPALSGTSDIPGCASSVSTNYASGFNAAHFDLTGVTVENSRIVLSTGAQAINPDSIKIPFTQEVSVTFLYEGAGYVSDFGWILKDDAVNADGSFKGWNNIALSKRHPLFHNIADDDETGGCCGGGDGIFDTDYGNGSFPKTSETGIAAYNDGTGVNFSVDGDGTVTPKDMKKVMGTFAGGTEIVFFLTADKDWNTNDTSGVFFTKKDWNPDTYSACGTGTFNKVYNLGQASSEGGCTTNGGWLTQVAITRMNNIFGVSLSGTYNLPITVGQKFGHVIIGAPASAPNLWILGWEDLMGGGDADHNDLAFRIERKTGGTAQLKSTQKIEPSAADAYYTAVTLKVYDNIPCPGQTRITYYLSIDNGTNWVEITEWDSVNEYTINGSTKTIGAAVSNWTPGNPQYTYRVIRVDFASRGLSGRELIWKAELVSEDENCIPQIIDVGLDANVATHGSFSRAEPVVEANVIYSGSYETPAVDWTEKTLRGHLKATRLYAPDDPSHTSAVMLWDAGAVLNNKAPSARNIYFPSITVTSGVTEAVTTGDGVTVTFQGTLTHYPLLATTIKIKDQTETFTDKHTDVLEGSLGGTGTINRFTGDFTVTFNTAPGNGVPIVANYSYYTSTSTLQAFNSTNVTNAMLGLDSTFIYPEGYIYDLDNDGDVDETDGDWLVNWVRGYRDGVSVKKEWLLGAVDHSVPAVMVPPSNPRWYYGTLITDSERASFDTFVTNNAARQTLVFVGARDGMLHAFDGGKFRWGDNPDTAVAENRGYYLWEGSPKAPNYGTGDELWAFIPNNLVPRFKNNLLKADDQSYVDASPALADVYVNGAWRTVLICAEGNGGDTVFALDVTNPASPTFLWEFADPDLFRSRSSPAVAKIGRILSGGTTKWAAFFVSGKTYDNTLYPSVYIIDISNGSVIQRVFLNAAEDGVGGTPSGQPAIVDSDGNGYIDRVYIGTDKGYMYKINMPDDPDTTRYSISHCVINTDFTSGTTTVPSERRYQPIYASPTVVVDNSFTDAGEIIYNVLVFFGTGDSPYYDEDINAQNTNYYFYAYNDHNGKGTCNSSTVDLDWLFELPAGNRVWYSAFAAAGNVYFGTSTAETEDPCAAVEANANRGMIYAFSISGAPRFSQQVGNVLASPIVEDEHLYFRTVDGLISLGSGQYNNEVSVGGIGKSSLSMWREIF